MDFHDWELQIQGNILQLRLGGLWPRHNCYRRDVYTVWSLITIICFLCGHTATQCLYMCASVSDLETLTQASYVLVSQVGGVFKVLYVATNMKTLKKLMEALRTRRFQPLTATQKDLAMAGFKPWNILYKMYWCSGLCTVFFFVSYPLLNGSYRGYRLPYSAWFPFDTNRSPNYQIVYLFQIVSLFFVACDVLGVDLLIAALNAYVSTQFEMMGEQIRTVFESVVRDFNQDLLKCVLHHQDILRFARDSNNFFNWMVLTQFFVSGISAAITLFQMTQVVPGSSEFCTFLCFEATVILELFMYCWFGNDVVIKSENARAAIFESNWGRAPLYVQKNLLFFALKCHKPVQISTFNLFNVSLDTFMKILKSSWSYYTLLKTIAAQTS